MCGRFAQYQSRDVYFDELGIADSDYVHDPEPIGRYNVAPGTSVLLLDQRDGELKLDPVYWGYGPEWWYKQPLHRAACLNRFGTTAAPRCFQTAGRSGSEAVTKSSLTLFTRKSMNRSSSRRSAKPPMTTLTGKKAL
ncbi:SOS response-associated peptidase family protein [Pantoea sp. B9002]|uniref:SOS response-associated peptidase family protein n=1 Tax=Pantoea sp. B9002 TaxID=2726979 RepID=UPI00351A603D